MQKKLIAVAVAALASTGAMAQVTMYGVADAYIFQAKSEGANSTATKTGVGGGLLSGSRLGFKAEEDLGDGMKAVALYEVAVNIDNGAITGGSTTDTGLFNRARQAYVGLDGSIGRLSLGQNYAHGYFAPGASDGFASAIIAPQTVLSGMVGSTVNPGSAARISNSVNFVSKPMGPVTVNAIYGFGEDNKDSADAAPNRGKQNNFIGLGAQAKMGGLTVDAVYQQKNLDDDLKLTDMFVGGAYNLGFVILGASYQTVERDRAAPLEELEDKIIQVSAIVPVGKGNVHFSYGTLDRAKVADDKATSVAIGYTHALGKRTTVYAGYNRTRLDDSNPFTYTGWAANAGVAGGKSSSIFATGMRLTF